MTVESNNSFPTQQRGTWLDLYPTSCSAVTHLYKQLAERGSFPNLRHTWNEFYSLHSFHLGNKYLNCCFLSLDYSCNRFKLLACFVPPALWWGLNVRYCTVTVCLSHAVLWPTNSREPALMEMKVNSLGCASGSFSSSNLPAMVFPGNFPHFIWVATCSSSAAYSHILTLERCISMIFREHIIADTVEWHSVQKVRWE